MTIGSSVSSANDTRLGSSWSIGEEKEKEELTV